MSHKLLRPFIVKVSVLGYFPIYRIYSIKTLIIIYCPSKHGYSLCTK